MRYKYGRERAFFSRLVRVDVVVDHFAFDVIENAGAEPFSTMFSEKNQIKPMLSDRWMHRKLSWFKDFPHITFAADCSSESLN